MFSKIKIALVAVLVLGSASAVLAGPRSHWQAPASCMTDEGNGRVASCSAH